MKSLANSRMATSPLTVPRTLRMHTARGLTSLPAGKMVPIAVVPLLREDSIRSGRLRFTFEMMETAEVLMNAVFVDIKAYLVPNLSLERFEGSMDSLNRSYEGVSAHGQAVVPYIETADYGAYGTNDIYVYLGLHGRPTQKVNTAYLEAYNAIWNFRAKNRSKDLALRTRLQANLAPAFWKHELFKHIVPDFDQAVIDGEVALNVVNSRLPVTGLGMSSATVAASTRTYRDSKGQQITGPTWEGKELAVKAPSVGAVPSAVNLPQVFAEMAAGGITVSLSNIELARKTQAFAQLRAQYAGHTDEWLINMLMDGLTVPEQAFKQPMLIGEKSTVFGMSKRYASDGASLTESVVEGATFLDMAIQLPRIPTGGVVMIVAEVTPEQLFERQRDAYFHIQNTDALPHYLRDTLDPEKVSVVPCEHVDIDHNTPTATFGYAPLNYEYNKTSPNIGGKFFRPKVNTGFDEDRQRIWAVETVNPKLATDFYLCTNIHTKPFVVTNKDPFECVTQGDFLIEGNTVFGGALVEAQNDYKKVLDKAPVERIQKP